MLLELRVKDLGIIEDIEWKLDAGLNVITGETGAGKSLVLDAVELLLTGSAGEDVIRHGASEARVEGVLAVSNSENFSTLRAFLQDKGITCEDEILIINCEIRRQKPGTVRINSRTVTKGILRQIGQLLIDIHGQSEHLSLLDKKYHLDYLDSFAGLTADRRSFADQVRRLHEMEEEIQSLTGREQDTARQEEFLKYQIDEIKKAKLQENEDEELEKERHLISHSEKLKDYADRAYRSLNESDSSHFASSALARLNEALQAVKKLAELDPSLNPQLEYLDKTIYGLEETARDVRDYRDKLDFDPDRLEEIESRLETIRNLKRKYGKTIPDILSFLEKSSRELDSLSRSSEKRQQLEAECTALKKEIGKQAAELSRKRTEAALKLETGVKKELQDLEMSQMQFKVSINRTPDASGIPVADGTLAAYTADGIDNVEFMVSTNPGEPLKPLAKIASTGEISRFTLALKGALSEADQIPVLIFDEVDIGVGGRSGDIIGRKLWALAQNHQVICVTHLPQIAAYADAHFCVRKEVVEERTVSRLEKLAADTRLHEMALMLAGPGYSETARENARELCRKADDWKKTVRV